MMETRDTYLCRGRVATVMLAGARKGRFSCFVCSPSRPPNPVARLVARSPPPPPDPASVVRHSAAVSEANPLIAEVRVSLSRPAHVFVEYDNQLAGRYRTALEPSAEKHTIPIVRLRPETTYDYTIFTVDSPDLLGASRGPGGSFTTGALPDPLASIYITVSGRSSQPLVLADRQYRPGHGGQLAYFVFFDEVGALVWYVRVRRAGPVARLRGKGNFVFIPRNGRRLRQFTPFGEVADFAELDILVRAHHDLVMFDGGRVLFPLWRTLFHDDSASGGLRTVFRYDTLGIWHSATGRVEQVWNAKETWGILDPAQHWSSISEDGMTNWTHVNSVSMGPRGNIVLSLRNRNQVVSLSPDYEIEWQLFGPDSDYEFPNPADRFYKQHTASELANGNILLFDNGNGRPDAEGGLYSRALELRLDDAAGKAVKVWEYRPDADIYAPIMSSAYRLNNGNTLVNFGSRLRSETNAVFRGGRKGAPHAPLVLVEADANGDEVFRVETVQLDLHSEGYRAYGGIEAIGGETMLRPPAGPARQSEERLTMRYQHMTHVAAGPFDVYVGDGRLVYAKAPCEVEDIALRFMLHVQPKEREDLPAARRESGFDNLDFNFMERGMLWQDRCHAELRLPEYAIDHIRTGQFAAEGEPAWSVEIPLTP